MPWSGAVWAPIVGHMAVEWWSLEILNASSSALRWRDAHEDALIESAITHGAQAWHWHVFAWGVVLEVAFADEDCWESWRALPGTRAALDAVPDPVNGLLVSRGRGGSSGAAVPRRPRPAPGMAAAALPEPIERPTETARSYPVGTS